MGRSNQQANLERVGPERSRNALPASHNHKSERKSGRVGFSKGTSALCSGVLSAVDPTTFCSRMQAELMILLFFFSRTIPTPTVRLQQHHCDTAERHFFPFSFLQFSNQHFCKAETETRQVGRRRSAPKTRLDARDRRTVDSVLQQLQQTSYRGKALRTAASRPSSSMALHSALHYTDVAGLRCARRMSTRAAVIDVPGATKDQPSFTDASTRIITPTVLSACEPVSPRTVDLSTPDRLGSPRRRSSCDVSIDPRHSVATSTTPHGPLCCPVLHCTPPAFVVTGSETPSRQEPLWRIVSATNAVVQVDCGSSCSKCTHTNAKQLRAPRLCVDACKGVLHFAFFAFCSRSPPPTQFRLPPQSVKRLASTPRRSFRPPPICLTKKGERGREGLVASILLFQSAQTL